LGSWILINEKHPTHININMKFKTPFKSATDRLISKEEERQLYEKAGLDIENNNIDKGLWVKALGKAEGDEVKQKGIYIELMVEHYKDELRAGKELAKTLATEANKEKKRQRKKIEQRNSDREWNRTIERFPKTFILLGLSNFLIFVFFWWMGGFFAGLVFVGVTVYFTGLVGVALRFYVGFFR
jgi:hypothetical protein